MKLKTDHFMHSALTKNLIVLAFLFISCSHEVPFEKQTKIFSDFMQKEFKVKLGEEKQFYFLVPTYTCIGCKKSAIRYFTNLKNKANNFLIITARLYESEALRSQENVFIDERNRLDRLNISPASTALLIWDGNKIQSIEEITPVNIDSLVAAALTHQDAHVQ